MKKNSFPNLSKCTPIDCISSKMMRCNRIVANIFRNHLKDTDITNSQLSILFYVAKSKNVTQTDISIFLAMEKSTVNRNIKRLLSKGYLESEFNSVLNTTNKGNRVLEKIIPKWNNAMSEVEKILGKEGLSSLDIIQTKLIESNA